MGIDCCWNIYSTNFGNQYLDYCSVEKILDKAYGSFVFWDKYRMKFKFSCSNHRKKTIFQLFIGLFPKGRMLWLFFCHYIFSFPPILYFCQATKWIFRINQNIYYYLYKRLSLKFISYYCYRSQCYHFIVFPKFIFIRIT